ncbi:Gfo/Idh/MocA family oxidoreductase [Nocardioides sp. CER19]|uniref:Gfo/Idh/MocA family protein n=1 Tax=Nocardioides sp. CER19 TaxID=3038538 RepID=UPI002446AB5F|nr:Gfo/Idh/MocA family oxidoreductase [Nocardioides sp. CER19]MDH2414026.1 Gfo/Idh/MocA family oxidoreductase [Nocardioides sp. CER19]
MRIGFLGVGRIGVSHAAVVAQHPAVEEVVVADADPARAREVAQRFGARAVETADEVFAAGVDGLVVATATDSHADLILRGAAGGLPVFCEKPVALDVPGTLRVRDAVASAGTPVQIGFQRRFDAGYIAARNAVNRGSLGELRRVHAVTADPHPPSAAFIPTSGGIYRDCLIHDFDAIRWVTGREIVEVTAVGTNRGAAFFGEAGDVDETVVLLTLDDGTLGTVHGSRYNGGGYDVRLEVAGTRGTAAVGLDDHAALWSAEPGVAFPADEPHPTFWERFAPAYAAEINAFLDVVRDGSPSPCGVDEALEALYVAEAATLSRVEGRRVDVAEVRK